MRSPLKLSLVLLTAVLLLLPTSTYASYTTVTGRVIDSKLNDPWAHGGTLTVFNCFSGVTVLAGGAASTPLVLDGAGYFSVSIDPSATYRPLCMQITFNNGGNGTPGNVAKGPYPDQSGDSGTLDTGVYLTGTGPTAVTLASFSAGSTTMNSTLIILALICIPSIVVLLMRRTQRRKKIIS